MADRSDALTTPTAGAESVLIDIRRLMDICGSVGVGVVLTDINGYFVEQNEPVQKMLGYTAEELRGKPFSELTHPDDVARNWDLFLDLVAGRRTNYTLEKRYIRRDGETVWARLAVSLFRDPDGRPLIQLAIIDDITEQKQTEQALATSRDRLSHQLRREQEARRQAEEARARLAFLADAGSVLAGSLDYETTLVSVAHLAVSSIADWCVVDLLDEDGSLRRVATAHADPEKERWACEVAERFRHAEPEMTAIREGRSTFTPEVTEEMLAAVVSDPEYLDILRRLGLQSAITVPLLARGHVLGGITLVSAESGRIYRQEDLALAEELGQRAGIAIDNARLFRQMRQTAAELEAVLGQMADGLVMADASGDLVYMNEAGKRLTGRSIQHVNITQYSETDEVRTLEGESFALDELPMMRALRGEIVTEATWRLTYPDRPDIIVQGSAAPVRGPDGELLGAVSSFRDVTEQAELEQQKDEFLSLVAHELRTPVTVIRGYAQLMQRRTPDERLAGPLSVMGRQVDQLVALIDELLDLSRVQTGSLEVNPVPLDYAELVQGVAEDVRVLHAGRRIELDVPPSLLVMADPIRLRQVLVNLLDNAAKYGPEESAITVQASLQGGACVTTVCDGGPALPADQREHIFTRFYRASEGNRAASGLGIGLYLARAIVEQHGGRIWLMEGDTCCFAFSIPIETAISSERA